MNISKYMTYKVRPRSRVLIRPLGKTGDPMFNQKWEGVGGVRNIVRYSSRFEGLDFAVASYAAYHSSYNERMTKKTMNGIVIKIDRFGWVLMMKIGLLLAFCAASVSAATEAASGPSDCVGIKGDTERLACYDALFSNTVSSPKAQNIEMTPLINRVTQEGDQAFNLFSITAHKPNYILPATYNSSADYAVYGEGGEAVFSDTEVKFQLSLKSLLATDLWHDSSLWVAYTQQSFWQLYADEEASAPFRETNHEPELIWSIPVNFEVLGFDARMVSLGFNHQSNGRTEPLSRSWNRLTGEMVFERGRFVASAKTWYRLEEDEEDDNNPDIEDYMGRIQLGLAYKGIDNTFALGVKNSLSSDNRSGVEFNWTFPLTERFRGFVQLYSGYGENMIDMENSSNRIGVGIVLTDWL